MYQVKRAERKQGAVLKQHAVIITDEDGSVADRAETTLEYLTFPSLTGTGIVEHLFTTRMGGTSRGIYESLNLSFNRGDEPERVIANYGRVAEVLGCSVEDMVLSQQTHTTNIRLVTESDRGKGLVRPLDYSDVDGLITDRAGIVLVTSFADCVPLYFVDPVHRAIGLAHSGWRGTAGKMGACMVEAMKEHFGTRPEDLLAAIGPSICQDCYEVSEQVAQEFQEMFHGKKEIHGKCGQHETHGQHGKYGREHLEQEFADSGYLGGTTGKYCHVVEPGREQGKYQLDLWLANAMILREAGIPAEQIAITDICTCHNPGYLFSHRASQGKRGNLGAFLMIKENRNEEIV